MPKEERTNSVDETIIECEVHYAIDPYQITNKIEKNNEADLYQKEETIVDKTAQNERSLKKTTASTRKFFRSSSYGSNIHLSNQREQKLIQKFTNEDLHPFRKSSLILRCYSFYETDKKLKTFNLCCINPYRPSQTLLNYMKKPEFLKLGNCNINQRTFVCNT
jgi:hypothetical protein